FFSSRRRNTISKRDWSSDVCSSDLLLADWGLTDDVAGLTRFTEICVEAFADTAAVVKPQVAFFEAYGAAGLAVLEDAQRALRTRSEERRVGKERNNAQSHYRTEENR